VTGPAGRPTLVVLRALGLGDLLTAVPALRALRRAHPDHVVRLGTPRALAPLLRATGLLASPADARAGGEPDDGARAPVDEVVDTAPLAPLDPLLHRATLAVNLHGRGPRSTELLAATRPDRLIAFRHGGPGAAAGVDRRPPEGPDWIAHEHEVHRWCRLLAGSGIPADPTDLSLDPPCHVDPIAPPGATVIHPGAAAPSRRWPASRFAAVARSEAASGRPVVVTGGPEEVSLAHRVARVAGLGRGAVLAGRTDLPTLAAVISVAGRVVCGDTGVGHLASAFGTPSVVLFGPVPPSEWGPPAAGPHLALWAGHRGDPHATRVDRGLLRITVEDVLAALGRLDGHRPSVVDPAVGLDTT
jgi:ADP-heptose:LPS heptosyltransferase